MVAQAIVISIDEGESLEAGHVSRKEDDLSSAAGMKRPITTVATATSKTQ